MSNNQSTQQSPQLSKQEPTSRRNRQFELLKNHPWLLLVVVGALLAAIATLAISSLVSIGLVAEDKTQTTINGDEATQFSEPVKPKSTNWLLAIVILGAGGVVIYRRIKTSGMPSFSWRAARSRLTRRQQRKLLLQQSKTAFTVEPQPVAIESPSNTDVVVIDNNLTSNLEPEEIALPLEEIAVDADLTLVEPEVITATSDSNPEESLVTILPPEKEEPIDPSTRSLAEMMDIRKHVSLYAILHDFHPKK